jgi:transcriptional regulator with XRE-family HTH domain
VKIGTPLVQVLTRESFPCITLHVLTTKERAKAVGERIVAARKRKGMSQVDLATKLAEMYGWPEKSDSADPETMRRSLGNNERGSYAPRLHRLQAIAEATGQPLEFFAVDEGGDGDGEPVPFSEAV